MGYPTYYTGKRPGSKKQKQKQNNYEKYGKQSDSTDVFWHTALLKLRQNISSAPLREP